MTSWEFAEQQELIVYWWLRQRLFKVHRTGYWAPFDIRTEAGTTLEVKAAHPAKKKGVVGWTFAIERHGKMCIEDCVDFYVFRLATGSILSDLGLNRDLTLILPADQVRSKYVWISIRSLLAKYAGQIDSTDMITESDAHKTPLDAAWAILRSARHSSQSARWAKSHPPTNERIRETEKEVVYAIRSAEGRENLLRKILEGNQQQEGDHASK